MHNQPDMKVINLKSEDTDDHHHSQWHSHNSCCKCDCLLGTVAQVQVVALASQLLCHSCDLSLSDSVDDEVHS